MSDNFQFVLFVHLASKKVEVAITGTAIPVLVNVQPSNIFDFGEVSLLRVIFPFYCNLARISIDVGMGLSLLKSKV